MIRFYENKQRKNYKKKNGNKSDATKVKCSNSKVVLIFDIIIDG